MHNVTSNLCQLRLLPEKIEVALLKCMPGQETRMLAALDRLKLKASEDARETKAAKTLQKGSEPLTVETERGASLLIYNSQ